MTTKKRSITPLNLPAYQFAGRLRAGRALAIALIFALFILPVLLVLVPWQQNISGSGHVSALNPLDRIRTIPAPVSGRLSNLRVQEGSYVKKGDLLAEMEDLDSGYINRLERQHDFVRQELEAAHSGLESLDNLLIQLQDEREFAVKAATSQLQVVVEKVRAERATLIGVKADLVQKENDYKRKGRLLKGGAKSELEFQEAEGAYKMAKAKVNSTEAKIDEARNEELAKVSDIQKVSAEKQAKIAKTRADRKDAEQKLHQVRKRVTEAETALQRQSTQVIVAPANGSVLRIHGAATDLISHGESLIEFVPETDELAVEFWVRGVDAPLVSVGRKVRLQFEGWPVVQVVGWPSVAIGTFGGVVYRSDALAGADGRVRILITPDPDDEPWPEQRFLRQGVRVSGQVQLDTVSAGYEIWRQLNAFPPSVNKEPKDSASKDFGKGKSSSKKAKGPKKP